MPASRKAFRSPFGKGRSLGGLRLLGDAAGDPFLAAAQAAFPNATGYEYSGSAGEMIAVDAGKALGSFAEPPGAVVGEGDLWGNYWTGSAWTPMNAPQAAPPPQPVLTPYVPPANYLSLYTPPPTGYATDVTNADNAALLKFTSAFVSGWNRDPRNGTYPLSASGQQLLDASGNGAAPAEWITEMGAFELWLRAQLVPAVPSPQPSGIGYVVSINPDGSLRETPYAVGGEPGIQSYAAAVAAVPSGSVMSGVTQTTPSASAILEGDDAALAQEAVSQMQQLTASLQGAMAEYQAAQGGIQSAIAPIVAQEEARLAPITDPDTLAQEVQVSMARIDAAALDAYQAFLATVPGSPAQAGVVTQAATVAAIPIVSPDLDVTMVPAAVLNATTTAATLATAALQPGTDTSAADQAVSATGAPLTAGLSGTVAVVAGLGLLGALLFRKPARPAFQRAS